MILSIIRSLAVQHFPVFARDLEQLVADIAIDTLLGESRKPVCLSAKKVNAVHDTLPRVFQAEARFAQCLDWPDLEPPAKSASV